MIAAVEESIEDLLPCRAGARDPGDGSTIAARAELSPVEDAADEEAKADLARKTNKTVAQV
mgnify:CR=1 FL=1